MPTETQESPKRTRTVKPRDHYVLRKMELGVGDVRWDTAAGPFVDGDSAESAIKSKPDGEYYIAAVRKVTKTTVRRVEAATGRRFSGYKGKDGIAYHERVK